MKREDFNKTDLLLNHFASIVENSDDAIISKDLDGIIITWNPAAENIFGYTAEEAIGRNISMLIPPERADEEIDVMKKIGEGGKVDHYETIRLRKNGERINILLTVSPIRDLENKIVGASKIAKDITGKKNLEIKNALLAAIVESSNDAIIAKTLDSVITSWNPAAEKIFGYKASEVIGKKIHFLIPQDRQQEEDNIISKIRRGERIQHFHTIRLTKAGLPLDISLTISPIKDETGKIIGASKIARDITKVKELERKKDEFISIASHELKTPLTSLKAYLQLLLRHSEKVDKKLHSYSVRAYNYSSKLEELVSDLLDITKIQAGKLQMRPETFDFTNLLEETVSMITLQSADYEIKIEGHGQVKLHADKHRIEQVLINFLTNAVKYSPKVKKVIVYYSQKERNLIVSVRDFGIGIEEKNLDKVFERFYRANEENLQFQGLGIGLYISKEIIQRHGGKIWVESSPGEGSTFYFTIPIN